MMLDTISTYGSNWIEMIFEYINLVYTSIFSVPLVSRHVVFRLIVTMCTCSLTEFCAFLFIPLRLTLLGYYTSTPDVGEIKEKKNISCH